MGFLLAFALLMVVTAATEDAGLSIMPDPFNVSVSCDNFDTVVYWNYMALHLRPVFRLTVKDDFGDVITLNTTQLHYNISSQLRKGQCNRYNVGVAAINGEKKSEIVSPKIFAFSKLKTADMFCKLDFPAVNLSMVNRNLRVQFANPLRIYRHAPALQKCEDDPLVLTYMVQTKQYPEGLTSECDSDSEMCEAKFPADVDTEREELCVNMTGQVGHTLFRQLEVCRHFPPESEPSITWIIVPILITLAVLLVVMGTGFFQYKEFLKMSSKFFPNPIHWTIQSSLDNTFNPSLDHAEPVSVEEKPLPPIGDTAKHPLLVDTPVQPGEAVSPQGTPSHTNHKDDEHDHAGNGYGGSVESESESSTWVDVNSEGYDRPHTFMIELAGDNVEAYGAKC